MEVYQEGRMSELKASEIVRIIEEELGGIDGFDLYIPWFGKVLNITVGDMENPLSFHVYGDAHPATKNKITASLFPKIESAINEAAFQEPLGGAETDQGQDASDSAPTIYPETTRASLDADNDGPAPGYQGEVLGRF